MHWSLSARRAWIENLTLWYSSASSWVALRKESVDRKMLFYALVVGRGWVALRKESVDRKHFVNADVSYNIRSLSARRAWIEMLSSQYLSSDFWRVALRKESVDRNKSLHICALSRLSVALRKESVDRNWANLWHRMQTRMSLSARRAWIEICCFRLSNACMSVALRKESVDRNYTTLTVILC